MSEKFDRAFIDMMATAARSKGIDGDIEITILRPKQEEIRNMEKVKKSEAITAYKVFGPDWKCQNFQFEVGKTFEHEGRVEICSRGFHACVQLAHCFSYYDFDPQNKVAEVLLWGQTDSHSDDSKIAGSHITIVRELTWSEVLVLANSGKNNSGHSNSGSRNSGYRNSGYRNSGYRNSGDSNSGSWNSGDRNSVDSNSGSWNSGDSNSGSWNSGDSNSGSWNSGDRNSGDSNSGYRNSGAFCTDPNPEVLLFDKPSGISMKDWENHEAMRILERSLETHLWISAREMSDAEKEERPGWEARDGYLKSISLKDAWADMWPKLTEASRSVFTSLPNFDAQKFEQITGINVEEKAKKTK